MSTDLIKRKIVLLAQHFKAIAIGREPSAQEVISMRDKCC